MFRNLLTVKACDSLPTAARPADRRSPSSACRAVAACALTLAALAGAGCATSAAGQRLEAGALGGRPVDVVVDSSSNFYADNKDRRRFGIVGVAAMAITGNQLVKDKGIVDPSQSLADSLRRSIAERDRLAGAGALMPITVATLGRPPALPRMSDPDARAMSDGPPLKLHVRTTNWEYRPFRGNPSQFYVIYAVRLDLVDARSGKHLATDRCQVTPTQEHQLTESELLSDDARKLKAQLASASSQCFAVLRDGRIATLLGASPPIAEAQPPL